jgi:hypothetical protein
VKDGETIVEGSEDIILNSTYRLTIARHDEPDIALTGHYW